ncbi:MAG: hypothetical protein KDK41_12165 [Leptospiraceae bacterium]|nr:hypothetical protein [Leptospiraceae bacterium]MCB1201392.1 hypothetical protein [Leptospiraceae bacterium]
MRNPFPENEVFNRFLGLKNHFREFQTQESRRRTTEISQLARLIQDSGDKISFDLLGSVNFGMAEATSDVDMVLYLDCGHDEEATYENCPMWRFYESLLITSILRELTDRPYHIQVVDCINLFRLEKAILNRGFDDDIIARFVFYRTICRGVNKRVIRPYEKLIMNDKQLFRHIEETLTEALLVFIRSSSHGKSFEKYLSRLADSGSKIPLTVVEKVHDYLQLQNK